MFNFIFVALGGALGAMGRYAISLVPVKSFFPFLTLVTNIVGAVVIGFIAGAVSVKEGTPPGLVLFLKVGVCGGFTTFSTFSLEMFNLLEQGKAAAGVLYAGLSVVCCVLGVYLGQMMAVRAFR